MSSSFEITPELMAGFLDEAPEHLEMLDGGLMKFESKTGSGVLSLETPEDYEQMNEMFRAAHSLKGLAAAFGFDKIKDLTHRMETLFDHVRMGKRKLKADSFELLFTVFDRLKALVHELADESAPRVEVDDIIEALQRVLDEPQVQDSGSSAPSTVPQAATETDESTVEDSEVFQDPELLAAFIEATGEAVEQLNQGLLGLENDPSDAEILNRVFRSAHNIKGAAGAARLTGMSRVTHTIETVFDHLRNARLTLDTELSNALFRTVDELRSVIDGIRDGKIQDLCPDAMCDEFAKWIEPAANAADSEKKSGACDTRPAVSAVENSPDDPDRSSTGSDSTGHLGITVTFADGFDEAPIQAYLIHNKLGDLGTIIDTSPDIDSVTGDTAISMLVFTVETEMEPSEIQKIVESYSVQSVVVSRLSESPGEGDACKAPAARLQESTGDAVPIGAQPVLGNEPTIETQQVAVANPPVAKRDVETSQASATSTVRGTQPESVAASEATPTPTNRSGGASKRGKNGTPSASKNAVKVGETLRVDQERLDDLMNLGGELIINRARFVEIQSKFRNVFDGKNREFILEEVSEYLAKLRGHIDAMKDEPGGNARLEDAGNDLMHLRESFNSIRSVVQRVHDARAAMHDFDEALHGLHRVSDGLQKGIMSTRMVSIGPLFNRFRRVVRDIAKSNGKQINLVLRGEHTELDKRMVDELGDPLTHIVRNAVDHGLETPEIRKAAGKDPTGTVVLDAYHRGNSICIEVTDDGAGINIDRVRAKVIEGELATPAQVETMSDSELIQYVLRPGFSTAEKVTDLSGRGMGMDIVVTKLEELNGAIEIDSTPGQGTRITIKLPLTLAILTSLLARIGKGIYALPLESVAEIITVRTKDIQYIRRRRVVRVRDRVVPIALFEDIFCTDAPDLRTLSREREELTLVIVESENQRLGLVVDELIGQDDVVIKSIAENYRHVRGFAGASIRGDGTVSLILDINTVIERAGELDLKEPVGLADVATEKG